MADYLTLCQNAARDCGIPGTGPSAVTGQTGQLGWLVRTVAQVYTDLQNEHPDWRWLRSEFTVSTTASDGQYASGDCTDSIDSATISRFARWWDEEFQIYLTSAGLGTRHHIPYVQWDEFRLVWLTGNPNNGYPSMVSIDPRNNLRLGPVPDAAYTFTGEYQKSPQILAANSDTPGMPARFHRLIELGTMKRFAAKYGAPEVWDQANNEEGPLKLALEVDQLPPRRFGAPLC